MVERFDKDINRFMVNHMLWLINVQGQINLLSLVVFFLTLSVLHQISSNQTQFPLQVDGQQTIHLQETMKGVGGYVEIAVHDNIPAT